MQTANRLDRSRQLGRSLFSLVVICLLQSPTIAQDEMDFIVAGQVVDAAGQPSVGAKVAVCKARVDFADGVQATTEADGKFSVTVKSTQQVFNGTRIEVQSAHGAEIGYQSLSSQETKIDSQALSIRLSKVKYAEAKVIDADDRPISGATVVARLGASGLGRAVSSITDDAGVAKILYTDEEPIAVAAAFKDQVGLDYHLFKPAQKDMGPNYPNDKPQRFVLNGTTTVKFKVVDELGQPQAGIKVYPLILRKTQRTMSNNYDFNASFYSRYLEMYTDANGEATCGWFPSWQDSPVSFSTSGGTGLVHSTFTVDPRVNDIHERKLNRTVPVRGTVLGIDGLPAAGITISAAGVGLTPNPPKTPDVKTDASGKYELLVAPNQVYIVVVNDRQWGSAPQQGFAVYPNTPVEGKDFKLRKATRVHGSVRTTFTLKPYPNYRVVLQQVGKSIAEVPDAKFPEPEVPRPGMTRTRKPMITHETFSDANGNFEFFVGDGEQFQFASGSAQDFRIAGDESYHGNVVIAQSFEPELKTTTKSALLGLVVEDGTDQPSRDCRVTIAARDPSFRSVASRPAWETTTDAEGKFRGERVRVGSFAHVISSNKQKAAIVEINNDKNVFVIKLRSIGSASGKLVGVDGAPVANQRLVCCFMVPFQREPAQPRPGAPTGSPQFAEYSTTDAEGNFRFEHLAPNVEYQVYSGPSIDLTRPITSLTVEPNEQLELGDIPMK